MTTTPTNTTFFDPIVLSALQRRMQGELLAPADPSYEAARRVVNTRFDRRPVLIARCHTANDVALAVSFAREHGLEISVRSGGHSVAGRLPNLAPSAVECR